MAINTSVQYNAELLPDIILLTQGFYHRGTRLNTMKWLCLYSLSCKSIFLLPLLMVYYFVFVFDVFLVCPCMAINVSVQYNGGRLPDIIILLTQCYRHQGTLLIPRRVFFCICSL